MSESMNRPWPFRSVLLISVVLALAMLALNFSISSCQGAAPDFYARMNGPSGCTLGCFAVDETGIWLATCKHCVSRSGAPIRVMFFKDGVRSKTLRGVCYAAHPTLDCAVCLVPWSEYPYSEVPQVVALSNEGPRSGATVYAVGSFAGGSVNPAARKLQVSAFRSSGYEVELNDRAWGGHSGGPVVDPQTGRLVGVLWGTTRTTSLVTSSRAIWELLYGTRPTPRSEAALFSVDDDASQEKTADIPQPVVDVYASRGGLERSGFTAALRDDANMQSIRWVFHGAKSSEVRFEFGHSGRRWYIDGWPGARNFVRRMNATNPPAKVQYCPDCKPYRGRDAILPINPWKLRPPAPPANPAPGGGAFDDAAQREAEALRKRLIEMEDAFRKGKIESEEAFRKLRLQYEDQLRALGNAQPPMLPAPGGEAGAVAPGTAPGTAPTDPLDAALNRYRERRRKVRDQEQRLKDASERIDKETADKPKPWVWPIAILGAGALLGGAYYFKR